LTFVREENMEFADRLFALCNGLPVPEEPVEHFASDKPSAFEKFHEQIVLDHYMGKRSQPAVEEIPSGLMEKIFAPRDYRDDGRAITPHSSGDLAKRFTPESEDDSDEEVIEEYSHGRVVAKLRNGVVISTVYIPKE
jgi:hypothetical protein